MGFPTDFVWGAATAAYQIEGAPHRTGGGESVWDMLCRRPGKIFDGATAEIACDHYRLYREDVRMMREVGLQAYRFSTSWPRIIPAGNGEIHKAGLDFYDRLVDELCAAGITPWLTLFHWDFPYELYLRGGWLNPRSSDWFADYTAVVVDKLSDRVAHWMTLNEPQCFVGLGHSDGFQAPGDKLGRRELLTVAHNVMLAHGKAVQVIRSGAKQAVQIGFAPVGVGNIPASSAPEDIAAARSRMFSTRHSLIWCNSWWMDPIFLGRYPEDGLEIFGSDMPEYTDDDLDIMSQPIDFVGGNFYQAVYIKASDDPDGEVLSHRQGMARTTYGWPITPAGLYWMAKFYWERYGKPIVVTENGVATSDWIGLDGRIHDQARIDYLHRHLLELERAGEDGVKIQAYFHWSLMDNFEWQEGYKHRFGLAYVDYDSLDRILKDSAYWYSDVIRTNGESLHRIDVSEEGESTVELDQPPVASAVNAVPA